MKKLALLISVFFSLQVMAEKGDSLLSLLQHAESDTQKIRINADLSNFWLYSDIVKSEAYNKAALDLATNCRYPHYKLIALKSDGSLRYCKSEFKKAIASFKLANQYASTDEERASNNLDISIAFASAGYNDSFFVYAINATKIYEKLNDRLQLAKSYGNIGLVCTKAGKNKDAKKYLLLSAKLSKELNENRTYSRSLHNLGVLYENLSNVDSALYYYNQALVIKSQRADSSGMITSYMGIANMSLRKKNLKAFNENMRKAIALAYRLQDMDSYSESLGALATGLYEQKQIDSATFYFKKSLDIALPIRDLAHIADCYNYLSDCSNIKGDYKGAFEYHKLYTTYKDSLLNENTDKQMETIKTEYETEKKEKENQLLQIQNTLSNETIEQQRITTYFIIGGLLISVLAGLFIFRSYKQKQKINVALEEKNTLIERQKLEVEEQKKVIEEHQKEIVDSINYAQRIQYSLLAHADLLIEHLPEHFVFFKPKDIVSGDFYWATEYNNCFYLAVCDSTGHGVPGAFMSLLNIGFLSEAIKEKNILEPHLILNHVRERLVESVSKEGQKDGMDAILICINKGTRRITYAAANNEPILMQDHQIVELPKDKMPVGKGERLDSFTLHEVNYMAGDMLYLYTDGYADQFGGPKGKKFKYKQLNELLLSECNNGMDQQKHVLTTRFESWKGNLEQVDDVCLIGIRL